MELYPPDFFPHKPVNRRNTKMIEHRKYMRFSVRLRARYLNESRWYDCSVVNVSREGMELELSEADGLEKGNIVEAEVLCPDRDQPIKVSGEIAHVQKHKAKGATQAKVGIKLTQIDAAEKWALLDTAYNDWYTKELEKGEQKSRQKAIQK
jgi:hypothetical protein